MSLQSLLFVALGLAALFYGGNWMVRAAARLAISFGVPALVVGMTIVAMGTSTPELLVSVSAVLAGSSDISLGNVVGSNIANIGLILSLAVLLAPFAIKWALLEREMMVMLSATTLTIVFAMDGVLNWSDGLALMVCAAAFILLTFRWLREDRQLEKISAETEQFGKDIHILDESAQAKINRGTEALVFVVGLVVLVIGAQTLITGAVDLARALGVSELLIGVTLVAVGTSLPELVTTVIAARNKEADIALGNVVGSNIANLFVILGLTAFLRPIPAAVDRVAFDLLFMSAFATILPILMLNKRMGRWKGALLMSLYIGYILLAVLTNTVGSV